MPQSCRGNTSSRALTAPHSNMEPCLVIYLITAVIPTCSPIYRILSLVGMVCIQ